MVEKSFCAGGGSEQSSSVRQNFLVTNFGQDEVVLGEPGGFFSGAVGRRLNGGVMVLAEQGLGNQNIVQTHRRGRGDWDGPSPVVSSADSEFQPSLACDQERGVCLAVFTVRDSGGATGLDLEARVISESAAGPSVVIAGGEGDQWISDVEFDPGSGAFAVSWRDEHAGVEQVVGRKISINPDRDLDLGDQHIIVNGGMQLNTDIVFADGTFWSFGPRDADTGISLQELDNNLEPTGKRILVGEASLRASKIAPLDGSKVLVVSEQIQGVLGEDQLPIYDTKIVAHVVDLDSGLTVSSFDVETDHSRSPVPVQLENGKVLVVFLSQFEHIDAHEVMAVLASEKGVEARVKVAEDGYNNEVMDPTVIGLGRQGLVLWSQGHGGEMEVLAKEVSVVGLGSDLGSLPSPIEFPPKIPTVEPPPLPPVGISTP
jgi:hypothetical protein